MKARRIVVTVLVFNISCLVLARSHLGPEQDEESSLSVEDDVRRLYEQLQRTEWQYGAHRLTLKEFRRAVREEQQQLLEQTTPRPMSDKTTPRSTPGIEEDDTRRQYNELQKNEWQYEGIPIDLEGFRRAVREEESSTPRPTLTTTRTTATTTTTSTTTPTTPTSTPPPSTTPSLRYRRVFNADETAYIEKHPYMAAILVHDKLWCGGVLLDRDTVLTAAHCLQLQYNNRFFREYVKMLSVRVGSDNATAGGEVVPVAEIYFHPNYKPETLEFNLAILKLSKNLSFNEEYPSGRIAYARDAMIPVDKTISFLGWGSVWGDGGPGGKVLLQRVELPVYDLADCQDVYGRDLVTRNNFCAGYITEYKNVCNHDAGGPAILDDQVVGILSFSSKHCDELDKPAVFSRVGAVVDWIEGINTEPTNVLNMGLKYH